QPLLTSSASGCDGNADSGGWTPGAPYLWASLSKSGPGGGPYGFWGMNVLSVAHLSEVCFGRCGNTSLPNCTQRGCEMGESRSTHAAVNADRRRSPTYGNRLIAFEGVGGS